MSNAVVTRFSVPVLSLLRWMHARGFGSGTQFRSAVAYVFRDDHQYFRLALRLSAAGYAEFDWNGPDLRWRVIPAGCYATWLPDGSRGLGVCGLLGNGELERLRERNVQIIEDAECLYDDEFAPRYYIRATQHARNVLADSNYLIADNAFIDLSLRVPDLTALLTAEALVELPRNTTAFNPRTNDFDLVFDPDLPPVMTCFREQAYPRPRYFWRSSQLVSERYCYPVDRNIAVWGCYQGADSLNMDFRGGTIRLPYMPSLPPIYSRLVYLSGASCVRYTKTETVYKRASNDLATMLRRKLPLRQPTLVQERK